MKTMFFATAAALLMLGGAAQAKPTDSEPQAVQAPEIVVTAEHHQPQMAANPLAKDNPTGLPAYEMRPDGLMINGLLPANGWES
jgi:hypothetical protein